MRIRITFLAALAAAMVAGISAAPALAQSGERDGRFTCRASLLRVGNFDPFIANDRNDPCALEEEGITGDNPFGGEALVATRTEGRRNPPSAGAPRPDDIVVSHTEAADVHVKSGGGFLVRVQGLVSSASVSCTPSGTPRLVGHSKEARISLLGLDLTTGSDQRTIPLGIGTLHLNRTLRFGNQLVQRGVELDLPGRLLDVVIGDARAGFVGNPCQG